MEELVLNEEGFGMCRTIESNENLPTDFEFWIFEEIEEFDDSGAEDCV